MPGGVDGDDGVVVGLGLAGEGDGVRELRLHEVGPRGRVVTGDNVLVDAESHHAVIVAVPEAFFVLGFDGDLVPGRDLVGLQQALFLGLRAEGEADIEDVRAPAGPCCPCWRGRLRARRPNRRRGRADAQAGLGTARLLRCERASRRSYSGDEGASKKKVFAILNARYHLQAAYIVSQAGVPGAITIATNMESRGTDIQLGGNADMRIAQRNLTRHAGRQPARSAQRPRSRSRWRD